MSLVTIAAIGFAMGFFGSIPLTGPIAVMAVSRAVKREYMQGMVVALGGTLGELIYCGLAVAGVGVALQQMPWLDRWVQLLSAALLFGVGIWFFFNVPEEPEDYGEPEEDYARTFASAFSVAALNPVMLLNWTAAVTVAFSLVGAEPGWTDGPPFVVGVGLGIVSWFAVLMRLLKHFQNSIPTSLLQIIQQIMSVLLVAVALWLAIRGLEAF